LQRDGAAGGYQPGPGQPRLGRPRVAEADGGQARQAAGPAGRDQAALGKHRAQERHRSQPGLKIFAIVVEKYF